MPTKNQTLLRSFDRALRAQNRSERTRQSYEEAALLLIEFHDGADLTTLGSGDIENFIGDQLDRHKPSTAASRFRSLRRLYRWLLSEEIMSTNPMARLVLPEIPRTSVPVLSDDELGRLLKVTAGKGFEQRRDHAIIRLFNDTGIRLGEMAGLDLEHVDLDVHDVVRVTGKGGHSRVAPFGSKAGTAVDRYLRERASHRHAKLPNLWVGVRGAMTGSGIRQMLERRGEEAKIPHLHPHRFRHTNAHVWLKFGGNPQDLKRLMGWSSDAMLAVYGSSAADERAVEAHRRMALGDRL